MVDGDLAESLAAEEIGAAIADVDGGERGAIERDGDEGRSHAAEASVEGALGTDGAVGGGDGSLQSPAVGVVGFATDGLDFLVGDVEEGVGGDAAGDFAAGGSAHAIADDVEMQMIVAAEGVLVTVADEADVGMCRRLDGWNAAHVRTP
jgi:hypothetical protein